MARRRWIRGAISHRGALHRALGIPMNRRIPTSTLEALARAPGKLGKRARLALTLRRFRRRR
jgi:hypothetical protein